MLGLPVVTMRARVGVILSCSCAVAAAYACGAPRVPAPAFVGQPTSALEPVPYPPPPARVEIVPPRPQPDAVWVDGEWTWQSRQWAWRRGRWVVPPRGAAFSPWTAVRDSVGTLYVAAGVFRDARGQPLADPPPIEPSKPNRADVVSPEGNQVPPSPVLTPGREEEDRRDPGDAGDEGDAGDASDDAGARMDGGA